jgi:trimethylamine--corrinoid protein Co-methyltransferase
LFILKANGVKLDGNIAFFTESRVEAAISTAPRDFILHGRNTRYCPCIGGSNTHYLAGYGAPYILENKVRRKAVLEDFIKVVKLVHGIGEMSINGGILVQPVDIPAHKFQLILLYTTVLFSDKALLGMTGSGRQQAEIMEFLKIV